jgi:hypothetical protein
LSIKNTCHQLTQYPSFFGEVSSAPIRKAEETSAGVKGCLDLTQCLDPPESDSKLYR